MVFNVIHGVDAKDPSTIMTPFQFDREDRAGVAAHRRGCERAEGIRGQAARARREPEGDRRAARRARWRRARRGVGGGIRRVRAVRRRRSSASTSRRFRSRSAAAGRARGGGAAARGDRHGGCGAVRIAGGRHGGRAGGGGGGGGGRRRARQCRAIRPAWRTLTRWTGGRFPRAFDFVQQQRRRQVLISQMAELLKDFDMYVPGGGYDVGLHAQTGHPCAVVPYRFESPPAGGGGRAAGAAGAVAAGAAALRVRRAGAAAPQAPAAPPIVYNKQPICWVICGNLQQRRQDPVRRAPVPDAHGLAQEQTDALVGLFSPQAVRTGFIFSASADATSRVARGRRRRIPPPDRCRCRSRRAPCRPA